MPRRAFRESRLRTLPASRWWSASPSALNVRAPRTSSWRRTTRGFAPRSKRTGLKACLTRSDHATGTDRLAEAARLLGLADDAIVVNVQGDEPLLAPSLIREVALLLAAHPDAAIATACHPIGDPAEAFNTNVVKVVLDANCNALYFSRATIPWARDAFASGRDSIPPGLPLYRHYGLYAYRAGFLRLFPALPPAPIERFEALEQLRALWHGHRIVVAITDGTPAPGVDTEDDLAQVRALYASGAA